MGKRYKSAFDAIADTPEQALNLRLRANLMDDIRAVIKSEGLTQQVAAERLGVTQPRVSDLLRGKLSLFSLDMLVNMLAALGREVEIKTKVA